MSSRHSTSLCQEKAACLSAAALYRRSDKRQEDSLDRQRQGVPPYAQRRGYTMVAEYVFDGTPGDEMNDTPEWKRLLRDAQAGKWKYLVADEPSRLSRDDPDEFVADVKLPLKRAGVVFDSVTKGIQKWDDLSGDIMAIVHAHKAREETVDLSRRVLGAQALKAKEGENWAWPCPYGLRKVYEFDPETGRKAVKGCQLGPEEEVKVVRLIFDLRGNKRWSWQAIADELTARGVRPSDNFQRRMYEGSKTWSRQAVKAIVRNRKYMGDAPWNECPGGKLHSWKGGVNGSVVTKASDMRRTYRNRPEEVIIVAGKIPAIVDRDLWERANNVAGNAPKRTARNASRASYLFRDLLVCGDCGYKMHGVPLRGGKGYHCGLYRTYGREKCHCNTIHEKPLLKAILDKVVGVLLNPARLDAIEAEIKRRLEAERSPNELVKLRKQIDKLDRDIAQAGRNLARAEGETFHVVERERQNMMTERAGLEKRLRQLESGTGPEQQVLAEARRQLWRLRDGLTGDDEELQAAVIGEVITKIEVKFRHEQTHGKRGKDGKGRPIDIPLQAILTVKPGLGLSVLYTSTSRHCEPAPLAP